MQIWRLAAVAFAASLMSACGATTNYDNVRLLSGTSSYPSLPDVQPMPPVDLMPFEYDMPRDSAGKIIPNSNIFIGFDLRNWQIILNNFKILEAREQMWQSRVDSVNKQRQEWRRLNEGASK